MTSVMMPVPPVPVVTRMPEVVAMAPVMVMPMTAVIPVSMPTVPVVADLDQLGLRKRREFDSGGEVSGRGWLRRASEQAEAQRKPDHHPLEHLFLHTHDQDSPSATQRGC